MTIKNIKDHPEKMTLMTDISTAQWVQEGLGQQFAHLIALMPRGFAAYARLFHPAYNQDGKSVRWGDIAAWSGRKVHPLMAFERISSPRQDYDRGVSPWSEPPTIGSLAVEEAIVLAEFLADFTDTAQNCFFAVWEGWGWLNTGLLITPTGNRPMFPPLGVLSAPRLIGVERNYVVYRGSLSAISSFFQGSWNQSPNIWWPEDRAWCVSTDIDLNSSYIGASKRCLQALAKDIRFEILPTSLDAPVFMAADLLNSDD